MRLSAVLLLAFMPVLAGAQAPQLPSTDVHSDGSITFRYKAPAAKHVALSIDSSSHPLAMEAGADGVWSVTTAALPAEIYSYTFVMDGTSIIDPRNAHIKPNLLSLASEVLVPGAPAMPWELTSVAHGQIDQRLYTTHAALHLPQDQEAYFVYTPPGYDAARKGGYPVLYLLHGWSDGVEGWSAAGRAGLVLDNLIGSGKTVPMIVVMPLGYGDYDFVTHGFGVWNDAAKIQANVDLFDKMLMTEIVPAVERDYAVAKDRDHRAIAGLSMGGLESLTIGLRYPDRFAFVGGMSAAVFHENFATTMPAIDPKARKPTLLWVACGTDDKLIQPNRDFVAWAKGKGLDVTPVETPGGHTWLVWRDNLVHLAPLLFRK